MTSRSGTYEEANADVEGRPKGPSVAEAVRLPPAIVKESDDNVGGAGWLWGATVMLAGRVTGGAKARVGVWVGVGRPGEVRERVVIREDVGRRRDTSAPQYEQPRAGMA